jgi:hypothetical protein
MESADAWLNHLAVLQAMMPKDNETQALASIALNEYLEKLVALCISDRDQGDRCRHYQNASDELRERLEGLIENAS